jgi:hypothetical protein
MLEQRGVEKKRAKSFFLGPARPPKSTTMPCTLWYINHFENCHKREKVLQKVLPEAFTFLVAIFCYLKMSAVILCQSRREA